MNFNSRKEYLDRINEVYKKIARDKKYPQIQEYWPLIRINIGYFLHLKFVGKGINYPPDRVYTKFSFQKLSSLLRSYTTIRSLGVKHRNYLKHKALIVGFNDHYNEDGIIPYVDPVSEIFRSAQIDTGILLLRSIEDRVKNPLADYFYYLVGYYSERFFLGKNKVWAKKFKKLADELKENFSFIGDEKAVHAASNTVIESVILRQIYYKAFRRFIKITKPKIIWTYVFYDNRILSLNLAANELKIPIVEYQHSMQGDEHFAYAKWINMDNNRYFPSHFWVWRNDDHDLIKRNFFSAFYQPSVIVGGNIYLARQKEYVLKNNRIPLTDKGVLVCLQGLWIPTFIEDCISVIPNLKWYFRLHPRYPNDRDKLLLLKNKYGDFVEIEEANSLSLYELFCKVKYNLTAFSGTALEAQSFGLTNIIFGKDGNTAYKNQISNGSFLFVESKKELLSILIEGKEGKTDNDGIQTNLQKIKESIQIIYRKTNFQ